MGVDLKENAMRARRWTASALKITPPEIYLNRRALLKKLGLGTAGLVVGSCGVSVDAPSTASVTADAGRPLPDAYLGDAGRLEPRAFDGATSGPDAAPRREYTVPERGITPPELATRFNNFYEFTTNKSRVWTLVDDFVTHPWSVEVRGLVHRPQVIDVDELIGTMPIEERVYRFRCVEAWSMTVPWMGFPLSALLDRVEPLGSARFVRMITANRPDQMPGLVATPQYPWPYHEGLRLDEAYNELTFIATGLYGERLPAQNGAPVRLVVPWKYGYKSIKSIVRIELTDEEPPTFWNTLAPHEYGFISNVLPDVPHPRWSQATEMLLDTQERIPTLPYNGYADLVAHLYE